MLAALLKVPSDRASADTGSSFKSMLDTLNHVYLAELVWFKRIQGENTRLAELESPADAAALAQAWPDLHKSWLDWAGSMAREDWPGPFTFRNNAGGESTMPYWQIAHACGESRELSSRPGSPRCCGRPASCRRQPISSFTIEAC